MGAARGSRGKITRPVPAKVTAPEITGYFPRKRLFRLLDAARKRPVIWISAPPGSGKTTLVSSYLDVRRLPRLWYQVDERDADVPTFFYYMGLAGRKAAPRKRKPMPLLTPEYLPGLPVFTRRYFDELFSRLPAPSVVVLDNYQKIPPKSMLNEVIRDAAACLPPKVNLLLVSRTAPPPAFAPLSANRLSSVIGWEEMRLTGEETRGIARRHGRRPFREEEIRRLGESADGWVAGLVLMLEKAAAGGVVPERKGSRTPEEIVDYFGGEVFGQADPDTRSFLLASAFLPRMTAEMAHRLTGYARAGAILSALCRNNMFTQARGHGDPVYEYHSLFREFLLSRAKTALPATEIQRLQRSAAELLAEQGQAEDAAALLRECGDWDGLARVILSQAPSLSQQGRGQTLLDFLGMLPKESFDRIPWLRFWEGVGRLPVDPGKSRACFEDAFRGFRAARDASGSFLAWAGVIDAMVYGLDNPRDLDPWITFLDPLIDEFGRLPPGEVGERATSAMIRALGVRLPPGFDTGTWADRCVVAAQTTSNPALRIEILINLALYLVILGEFRKAEILLGTLQEAIERFAPPPAVRLMAETTRSMLFCMTGRHDRVRDVVSEGVRLAEDTGISTVINIMLGPAVLSSLVTGDMHAAGNYLDKMASFQESAKPQGASIYHYLLAWQALYLGDSTAAAHHSELTLKLTEHGEDAKQLAVVHLQRAIILDETGGRGNVAHHLSKAREFTTECKGMYPYMFLLTKAYLAFRNGEERAGIGCLRESLPLGREMGIFNLYMAAPGLLDTVCGKALEAEIEVEYVREMIRRNRLVPDPSAPDLEKWPWPVKVYTLGRFSLVVDGKTLPPARKTRQKPLLLLKALIALGGRDVPEEQLAEILWPDADGDLAHQSMAKTLERLREMLGDDRAVLLREGRLTLNNRHCWVDVWEFERILGRANAARKPGALASDDGEVARLTERATALYGGTFLSGETFCSCIVTYRERLRSKFLRTIVQAGRHWEKAGEWERAIACYQKGLEVDPISEEMYRGLISCNVRMGRAAEAHAVYQRCCKTLSAVLGVPPSPDLRAILASGKPPPHG